MDLRELKGLEIAARMRVTFADGAWSVPSQSGNGKYTVRLNPDSCTCDDFTLRQKPCKHIYCVRNVQERDQGGAIPPLDTEAVPKRPTYKQNWPAYNLAQTTEKHRFQVLLRDLCQHLPEPEYKGGRPRIPMADLAFAAVFKVYSTVSSRRFMCDLADAHAKDHLSKLPHYNRVNKFLEDPLLTPVLKDLLVKSSLPLRAVEKDFAVDSSGFSTSRFVRWYDEKYGVTRSGHDWVKVHLAVGVKTHIITAAAILDRNAGDSPQFLPLVRKTAEQFEIHEVSGDKAFSSYDNLEGVAALGGTAFIPFKVNATPDAGGLWEKMYHYYQFRRDEFLQHYHKRSNVESTLSAVKAKFRDHVRSRCDVAMANEVFCKLLCHNLCVCIQSHCELGIESVFWQAEAKGAEGGDVADVLPLQRPG